MVSEFILKNIYRAFRDPIVFYLCKGSKGQLNRAGYLAFRNLKGRSESQKIKTSVAELRKEGFLLLHEHFCEKDLKRVCLKFEKLISEQIYTNKCESEFDHQDKFRITEVFSNFPEIAALVFDEEICEIISRYKNLVPGYQVNCYRTNSNIIPQGSSNFHQDQYGDFSIFIALEDIDETNGASQFVPRSHQKSTKFWNSYFLLYLKKLLTFRKPPPIPSRSKYYGEKFVDVVYPKNTWRRAKVKKGSVIFMDVSGIHRGPYWDSEVLAKNARSRSVIHIVARENVLIGSGKIVKQPMGKAREFLDAKNAWGNAVIKMTELNAQ